MSKLPRLLLTFAIQVAYQFSLGGERNITNRNNMNNKRTFLPMEGENEEDRRRKDRTSAIWDANEFDINAKRN